MNSVIFLPTSVHFVPPPTPPSAVLFLLLAVGTFIFAVCKVSFAYLWKTFAYYLCKTSGNFAPIRQIFLVLGGRRKGREGHSEMLTKGTHSGLQAVQEPMGGCTSWKSTCGAGHQETCTFALALLQETSVKFLRSFLRFSKFLRSILRFSLQISNDSSLFTPTRSARYVVSIPISSWGMTFLRKLFSSTHQLDRDGTSLVPRIISLGGKRVNTSFVNSTWKREVHRTYLRCLSGVWHVIFSSTWKRELHC